MIVPVVKRILQKMGFELRRRKVVTGPYPNIGELNMTGAMQRSHVRGLTAVKTVLDIGAAEGLWSLSAKQLWPDADYVLFEPLAERIELLTNLSASTPGFHFVPKGAGKESGSFSMEVTDCLDASMITDTPIDATRSRLIEVTSIDEEVANLGLDGPFIVKLDTHGFELPILEGCAGIFDRVSLFIIECYGYKITKDTLLFWEICQYMESKGFRLVDVVDIVHRPLDQTFWQCDAFFCPVNSPGMDIVTYNAK
nr:FkbM family methyltransferase [uncultured Mucilaginibacter sp.]